MNDSQLLERLASTDAYAPQMPLPASTRSRDAAIAVIERSTDMQTYKKTVPQAPPRRIREGWLAAAAAFVVVLIVGAVMVFLAGQGNEDVVDPTTTTSAIPTTITTVPPPPEALPQMVDSWQQVGAGVVDHAVDLRDMTLTGSGLLAVGWGLGEDGPNGVVFTSDNGVDWVQVAEDDPALTLGTVNMYGVTEGGPGLVAVGLGCEDDTQPCSPYPTVWTSTDGSVWDRSTADAEAFGELGAMLDVAATSHGIVAVGNIGEFAGDDTYWSLPAVWMSSDGIDWSTVWTGEALEPGGSIGLSGFVSIAESPDGLLVGVGVGTDNASGGVGAVWVSTDGLDWERTDAAIGVFGPGTAVQSVTWGTSGFVAVGTEDGFTPVVWQSVDGYVWTRVDVSDQPFDSTGTIATVAALDDGYVAAGPHIFTDQHESWVTLWTSPDGQRWDRVQTFGQGGAGTVLVADAGIAVAGIMLDADGAHAAIWAGPLFDPEAPPPDPEPPLLSEPEPVPPSKGIGAVAKGASCEEIAADGFGYAEAVSYWAQHDMADDFDLDFDGPPCQGIYSEADVIAVFGEPAAASMHLAGDYSTMSFTITGPAVDAGIICAEGTFGDTENIDFTDPALLWRWEDVYTCADDSGTFTLGINEYINNGSDDVSGVWDIVAGTGNYEALKGGGLTKVVDPVGHTSIGRVWLETNES